jgi:citronellyl-CoA dehydrogenase
MQFTQEHDEIRRTLRAIIDRDINPMSTSGKRTASFPRTRCSRSWAAPAAGIHKPVEYGGMGLDLLLRHGDGEELGHHCGSVPMAIGVQTDMATPALARYGSDEMRREFLAPSIAGDYVACPRCLRSRRRLRRRLAQDDRARVGGDYVINGGKMWTTNGTQADWMCLLANTGDGQAHKNKSLICLPMKTKGVQVVKKLDKLGMRSLRHRADLLRRGEGAASAT